jgi:hypothetical protein
MGIWGVEGLGGMWVALVFVNGVLNEDEKVVHFCLNVILWVISSCWHQ